MPPPSRSSRHHSTTPPPPSDATSQSAYLSALRQIDRIPVPDLASTLTTSASDEDDEDVEDDDATEAAFLAEPRLSYLRTNIEDREIRRDPTALASVASHNSVPGPRTSSEILESHRQRITHLTDTWRSSMEERDARLDRLERVLAQLNRMQGSNAAGDSLDFSSSSATATWSNHVEMRTMELNRQAELARMQRESTVRQEELLRIQQETREVMRLFMSSNEETPNQESLEYHNRLIQQQHQARIQALQERAARTAGTLRTSYGAGAAPDSDRTARQDWRRHPRFWTRHRDLIARNEESAENAINSDRGMQTDHHDDRTSSSIQATGDSDNHGAPGSRQRTRRPIMQDTADVPPSNLLLRDTLTYLSKLRSCSSREEAITYALQAGFSYKDFGDSTFVASLEGLKLPEPTSLMSPGAIFKGAQFSNSLSSEYHAMQAELVSSSTNQVPVLLSSRSMDRSLPDHYSSDASKSFTDSWPVKVSIYDVDYENMTLSASMEAYDVPSHPYPASPTTPTQSSGTSHKPITTFLEGEIIDLKRHTFITENFTSTLAKDLIHWRKLPPFNDISPAELPRRLVSREFLADLNANYVLMRWKERCFVSRSSYVSSRRDMPNGGAVRRDTPDESVEGCNLTISGFYFASLRRSDGLIEGLYCDPQSSPYQFLSLNRVKIGVFPSWAFK